MLKDYIDAIITSLLICYSVSFFCVRYAELNIKHDMKKFGVNIHDENNLQWWQNRYHYWVRWSLLVVIFILILWLIKLGAIPAIGFFGDGEDWRPPGGWF